MKLKKTNEQSIEIVRAIAAFLVVIGHARAFFFEPYSPQQKSVFVDTFYFITGFGHQAVLVFFVVSGYLIYTSLYRSPKFTFKSFIVKRVVRLWVVLLPALLLTLIIDSIGVCIDKTGFYSGGMNANLQFDINIKQSLELLLLNLFFLNEYFGGAYGSNLPLWSLSYEFTFYVLFGLMFLAFNNAKSRDKRKAALIVITSLFLFCFAIYLVNYKILLYFSLFLVGVFASILNNFFNRNGRKYYSASCRMFILLLFIGVLSYSRTFSGLPYHLELILSLVTAMIIIVFSDAKLKILVPFARLGSNISYPLYLVHFPILAFLFIYSSNLGVQNSVRIFLFSILICVFVAVLFYRIFESKYKIIIRNFIN